MLIYIASIKQSVFNRADSTPDFHTHILDILKDRKHTFSGFHINLVISNGLCNFFSETKILDLWERERVSLLRQVRGKGTGWEAVFLKIKFYGQSTSKSQGCLLKMQI